VTAADLMLILHHFGRSASTTRTRTAAIVLLLGAGVMVVPDARALAQEPSITDIEIDASFDRHIKGAARRFGLPEGWIRAVIHVESAGDPGAVSPAGALGLMQIMPGTWADLRNRYRLGTDPFDPRDNISAGTAYLREMYDEFGSPGFLAAYNAGPARYAEHLATGRRLPRETQTYVAKLVELLRFETSRSTGIVASDRSDWRNAGLFVPTVNSIAEAPSRQGPAHLIDDKLAATPSVPDPIAGRNPWLFVAPLTAEEAP
jgi:Transglycosylase SLT domain